MRRARLLPGMLLLSLLVVGASAPSAQARGKRVREFPIPTVGGWPEGITAGPDGNLWFTEYSADNIGRITTQGAITTFPLPRRGRGPVGIAAGPDGNLWFAEIAGNGIGRITTEGVVTEYLIPTHQSQPVGIAP